jgi:uncharacterized protein (DUF1501 family)
MNTPHILTRRNFFSTATGLAATAALSSLTDVPLFVQKALAEGGLGQPDANGRVKKLLFIFLRGANDGLNNVIPHGDDAYGPKIRDNIAIPVDPAQSWNVQGKALFPEAGTTGATFAYPYSLPLGNGFAGLHPAASIQEIDEGVSTKNAAIDERHPAAVSTKTGEGNAAKPGGNVRLPEEA